jgi:hypothetical protein
MGEAVRFIPKSERERTRLIQQARAAYDSIFPSAESVCAQRDRTPESDAIGDANAYRSEEDLPS